MFKNSGIIEVLTIVLVTGFIATEFAHAYSTKADCETDIECCVAYQDCNQVGLE